MISETGAEAGEDAAGREFDERYLGSWEVHAGNE